MTIDLEPYEVPFTILVDTAESQPFTFTGITADANKDERPLKINTRFCSLGRHPDSLGDYSIEGMLGRVHVERKSIEDCQGTVLGWESKHEREKGAAGRRERFKQELQNLAGIEAGLVVVEGTLPECMRTMPSWGKKDENLNAKIFFRSVQAFMQDYKVPWQFCSSRRMAEVACFRWLERFWKKEQQRLKEQGR
jgi:hypothetical protein